MIRPLVPDVPDPLNIPDTLKEKIESWIAYFQKMSPRLKIIHSFDPRFKSLKIEKSIKKELAYSVYLEDMVINTWPTTDEIAFIVSVNTAMPGHLDEFLTENSFLFCYGDFAFILTANTFKQIDLGHDDKMHYEFEGIDLSFYEWKFQASIVASILRDLQEQIPPPPEI